MTEWVEIGNAKLACGDSMAIIREIMEHVDCTITDPPYGVNLGNIKTKNTQAVAKKQESYLSTPDTPEYIKEVCAPIIEYCVDKWGRLIMTPGNRNMFSYPEPAIVSAWFNPAGTSRGKWGYICASPICYYGKDPRMGKHMSPDGAWGLSSRNENVDHPCPKPLPFMKWMVNKGSLEGETILDPFMGSGTTGVAALQLGRKFIGIELDPKYFNLACRRIEDAQRQKILFQPKHKQGKL